MKKILFLLMAFVICSSLAVALPELKGGNITTLTDTYVEYKKLVDVGDNISLNAYIKLTGTDLINKVNSCTDFWYDEGVVRISPAFEVEQMELDLPRNIDGKVFNNPTIYHCDDLQYNETTNNCTSGWEEYPRTYDKVVTPLNGLKITDVLADAEIPSWIDIPNESIRYVPNFKTTKYYDMFYFKSVNSTYTVGPGQNYTTLSACLAAINGTYDACNIVREGTYTADDTTYYWDMNDTQYFIDIQSDNVVLDGNNSEFISNFSGTAIHSSYHMNVTIKNCNISYFEEAIYFDHVNYSAIYDNIFQIPNTGSNYDAVNLYYSPHNDIFDNYFTLPLGAALGVGGLTTQNRLNVEYSPDVAIYRNVLEFSTGAIYYSDNVTAINNTFSKFGVGLGEFLFDYSDNVIIRGNVINSTIGLLAGLGLNNVNNAVVEDNLVQNNFLLLGILQSSNNISVYDNVFEGTPDAFYLKNLSILVPELLGVNCSVFVNLSGQDPKVCDLSFSVMLLQQLLGGSGMNLTGGNVTGVNMNLIGLVGGSIGAIYATNDIGVNFTRNLLRYDGFGFYVNIDVDHIYFVNDYLGIGIAAASFDMDNSIIYDNDFIIKNSGLDFKLNGNTTLLRNTDIVLQLSPVWIAGTNTSVYDNNMLADYVSATLDVGSINVTGERVSVQGAFAGLIASGIQDLDIYDNDINMTNSGLLVDTAPAQNVLVDNLTLIDSAIGGIVIVASPNGGNLIHNNSIYVDTLGLTGNIVASNDYTMTNSAMRRIYSGVVFLADTNGTSVYDNDGIIDNVGILLNTNGSANSRYLNTDLSDDHFGMVTLLSSSFNYFTRNNFALGEMKLKVPFATANAVGNNITSFGSSFAFYNLVGGSNFNNITQNQVTGQALSPIELIGLTNGLTNSNCTFVLSSVFVSGDGNEISHNDFANTLNGSFRDVEGENSTIDIYEVSLVVDGDFNNLHNNEFDDTNSNLENYSYSLYVASQNNTFVFNHFLSGEVIDENSSRNFYCVGGNGNFYKEGITPMVGDCGPIGPLSVSIISNGIYNTTWKIQNSDGKTMRYVTEVDGNVVSDSTNTFSVLPLARGYHDIEIIPYYGAIRGTHSNLTYFAPTTEERAWGPLKTIPEEAGAGLAIFLLSIAPYLAYFFLVLLVVCTVSAIAWGIFKGR